MTEKAYFLKKIENGTNIFFNISGTIIPNEMDLIV